MINIHHIKTVSIFLNEFYYINGIPFQSFIDELKMPIYDNFRQCIQSNVVFSSFLKVFGIYTPCPSIIVNNILNQVMIKTSDYCLEIYYLPDTNIYKVVLNYKGILRENQYGRDWIEFVLSKIKKSQVISYSSIDKQINITMCLNRIKTGKPTSWQKIFTRILVLDYHQNTNSLKFTMNLFKPNKKYDFYPLDEIVSNHCLINCNIIEKLKSTQRGQTLIKINGNNFIESKFKEWLDELDWKRKSDYILTISKIKYPIDNEFYNRFMNLDKMIRMFILNYL